MTRLLKEVSLSGEKMLSVESLEWDEVCINGVLTMPKECWLPFPMLMSLSGEKTWLPKLALSSGFKFSFMSVRKVQSILLL